MTHTAHLHCIYIFVCVTPPALHFVFGKEGLLGSVAGGELKNLKTEKLGMLRFGMGKKTGKNEEGISGQLVFFSSFLLSSCPLSSISIIITTDTYAGRPPTFDPFPKLPTVPDLLPAYCCCSPCLPPPHTVSLPPYLPMCAPGLDFCLLFCAASITCRVHSVRACAPFHGFILPFAGLPYALPPQTVLPAVLPFHHASLDCNTCHRSRFTHRAHTATCLLCYHHLPAPAGSAFTPQPFCWLIPPFYARAPLFLHTPLPPAQYRF